MIAAEVQNIKASWLSDIPSHWNVVRLKTIVKGGTNGVWGSEPKNNKNDIICVRVADIDEWQYGISQSDLTRRNISDTDQSGRLLNFGDLIIEKSGGGEISPVGRVVIFNLNEKAVTSNFMARLNVIGEINKEFLYYYFRFLYYRRLNHPAIKATTGIQNLDLYAYLQNPIPIPTPKEQIEIVGFINHTSGEITRFIQTKQRFIELLKEQRQSIITNAVTKGIDENVKMKETVLGEIPEHWEVRRLKFIAEVNFSTVDKHSHKEEKQVRLCNYVDVYKHEYITNDFDFMIATATDAEIKRFTVKKGDVIITKDSETAADIAIPALVVEDLENVVCAYHLAHIKPNRELVESEFLFRLFQSKKINSHFEVAAKGVTRHGLSYDDINSVFLPYPPTLKEQQEIIKYIRTETKTLDIAISKAEREIELIKEYREAMVAEAVTGKMKL